MELVGLELQMSFDLRLKVLLLALAPHGSILRRLSGGHSTQVCAGLGSDVNP
jgi:hypothetical protein